MSQGNREKPIGRSNWGEAFVITKGQCFEIFLRKGPMGGPGSMLGALVEGLEECGSFSVKLGKQAQRKRKLAPQTTQTVAIATSGRNTQAIASVASKRPQALSSVASDRKRRKKKRSQEGTQAFLRREAGDAGGSGKSFWVQPHKIW